MKKLRIRNISSILIACIVICALYTPCFTDSDLSAELTREDGVYESVGASLFLVAAFCFLLLALAVIPQNNKVRFSRNNRRFFALFSLLFFFAFGEEISWGQRILNFETPEVFAEQNRQGEFNIHNLDIFHGRDAQGQEKEGWMSLLSMHRLFYIAFGAYLIILPFLSRFEWKFIEILKRKGLVVPSFFIGILFIFNWIFAYILKHSLTGIDTHDIVEIKESIMAGILLVIPLSLIFPANE